MGEFAVSPIAAVAVPEVPTGSLGVGGCSIASVMSVLMGPFAKRTITER
jgi:hypothetical protein